MRTAGKFPVISIPTGAILVPPAKNQLLSTNLSGKRAALEKT